MSEFKKFNKSKKKASSKPEKRDDGLDSLTVEELVERFESLLDDMNLSDEKREPLRKQDPEKKKDMLRLNMKREKIKIIDPAYVVKLLNDWKGKTDFLSRLRVDLATNKISWIKSFGPSGLISLLNILKKSVPKDMTNSVEAVRCISFFINSEYGMDQALSLQEFVYDLYNCIDKGNDILKYEIMRILAVITLYPNGHFVLLNDLKLHSERSGVPRFLSVVQAVEQPSNLQLKSMSLQLINALVNTPDEWEFRQHLRAEILRLGLLDLVHDLQNSLHDDIKVHADLFIQLMNSDHAEFESAFQECASHFETMDSCLDAIRKIPNKHVTSILQHLLFVRDEHPLRELYLQLIETCVGQIVLRKNGMDPDPAYHCFNFDVEEILCGFDSKLTDNINTITQLRSEYEDKLAEANTSKTEAETNVALLQEKIEKLQNEKCELAPETKIKDTFSANKVDTKTGDTVPPPPPPLLGNKVASKTGDTVPPPPPPLLGNKVASKTGDIVPPPPPPLLGNKVASKTGDTVPPPPPPMIGGKMTAASPQNIPAPPPMMGKSVPPPPPSIGGKVPPPVGSQQKTNAPNGMKSKPIYPKSQTATKRINWDKLRPQNIKPDCIWTKFDDEKVVDDSIVEKTVQLFAVKEVKKSTTLKAVAKAKELKLLDGKAAQNFNIMFGQMRKKPEEVKQAFLEVDSPLLTSAVVEQFIKNLPGEDELNSLKGMVEDINELEECEQYLTVISEVKSLPTRLECLSIKLDYSELLSDTKTAVAAVTSASSEVKASQKFSNIIQLILSVGNILNANSRNAETYAFNLKYLPKLIDTKSCDNSTNLLNYIAQLAEEKCSDSLNFPSELISSSKASNIKKEEIISSIELIKRNHAKISKAVNGFNSKDEDDKFMEIFGKLAEDMEKQIELLSKMKECMDESYSVVADHFSFSEKSMPTNEFFSIISNFCAQFSDAVRVNQKNRLAAEKKQQSVTKVVKSKKEPVVNDEGLMDSLLDALKTGKALNKGQDHRKRRHPDMAQLIDIKFG